MKYYSSMIVYRLWLTTVFSNISCSSKLSLIVTSTITELSFTFSTLPCILGYTQSNFTISPTLAVIISKSSSFFDIQQTSIQSLRYIIQENTANVTTYIQKFTDC